MPSDHVQLTIVFDLRAEPIAGVLRGQGGPAEVFAGWMELTRAIERALHAARQAPAKDQGPDPDAPARARPHAIRDSDHGPAEEES